MATLAQLQAEPWWSREIATSPMVGLGLELRVAYGAGALSVGIKGNERHLSGGHRSQEWIKNSVYCTNRTYATQTGLTGDQLRYCAALDFTPAVWGTVDNRAKMRVLTKRMIDAMKAGRADEVLEVFGTLDGTTVTGYRNDTDTGASSDSSHLDHIHIRFDRRYCNDNAVMSKVAAILLGGDTVSKAEVLDALDDAVPYTSGGVAQWAADHKWAATASTRALLEYVWQKTYYDVGAAAANAKAANEAAVAARDAVIALNAKVGAIAAVDPAKVAAELAALPEFVAALADAVAGLVADREAAADRARADVLDGPG